MKSNFDFFTNEYELLKNLGRSAEQLAYRDPSGAIMKIRIFSEELIELIAQLEGIPEDRFRTQYEKLRELIRQDILPEDIFRIFETLRKFGNKAAHDGKYVINATSEEAIKIIHRGHYLGGWFMELYGSHDFKRPPFYKPVDVDSRKDAQIEALEKLIEEQKAAFEKKLANHEFEQKSSKEEKEERRTKSRKYTTKYPPTEALTRELIDEQLRAVGWETDSVQLNYKKGTRPDKKRKMAIAEWKCGKGYADYALFDGMTLVGIVEAKKYGKDIAGDLFQAKEYARNVMLTDGIELPKSNGEYHVPFIYSTNGRPYLKQLADKSGIWFWDARTPKKPSFALESWHSPEDLKQKLVVDENQAEKDLKEEPYPNFASRHYQISAVKAVEEALENNQRKMLLAMATGTGKTRTALSIMYRLIKTKRVRRILFLVDRTSLGKQTGDALKDTKIENSLAFSDIYEVKEVTDTMAENSTKIQIATVQGMVKRLFYSSNPETIPSVGTYDFIIVDEAHRGYLGDKELSEEELTFANEKDYVSQYRRVIDYFDATVLALTATPALHTTDIFGPPIYTYSYTDAVVDGYLVDHEPPIKFETELSTQGIIFEKGEVNVWDNESHAVEKYKLEDELKFDVDAFNKKVLSESFNREVLKGLISHIDPDSDEKTLIFAATDNHADQIVRLLKEIFLEEEMEVDDDAVLKITGSIRQPLEAIKRFKNEKYPNIVVTVDLLTTGIDVPTITNLVFMRRVRSRILYDQMLGRATRLCPEIGKEAFRIFDAVRLYDHLQNVTDMKPLVSNPKRQTLQILEEALEAPDDESFGFFKAQLMAKLQRKKQTFKEHHQKSVQYLIEVKSIDNYIASIKTMTRNELERQRENIQLISEFRSHSQKIYISDHEDKLLGTQKGYGEGNQRPGDYLDGFNAFIRQNINLIPALNVVVNRPKDLTREDLRQIRLELTKKKYDENGLREAWKSEKNEYIAADIISFIRQAALGSPLIDHEDRIKAAMRKVYAMADWTKVQLNWLNRIEKQLLKDPVLAPTAQMYFDETEQFKQQGGYKKIVSIFKDQTDAIVETINESLYA